jgi:hypothetical protein
MENSRLLKNIASAAAGHERELAVVREPQARSLAQAKAARFASAELATLDQLARNQCSHYARRFREWFGTNPESDVPHPVADHQRSARLGRWGARLLMSFEVAFAAWLTATFNFAQHLWAAMAATATLWLAASSGLSQFVAMLLRRRSEVPQETRSRIHQAARIVLIVWLAGAALILIMRTAQGKTALVLAHATTFTLAAWAIATILLAGCGIGADRLFRWSDDATREYYLTMRLRSRISQLLDTPSLNVQLPSRAASSTVGKLAVALAALAMLGLVSGARAQTSSTTPAAPSGCTYIDKTTSVQSATVEAALEQHAAILPELAKDGLKSWCFVPFGSNAWTAATAETVQVPAPAQAACSPEAAGEADVLFRGVRDERAKKAQQACAAERARSTTRFAQDLQDTLSRVARDRAGNARCSSVLDALDRVAHTPDLAYAVVVTDGQENCGSWRNIEAPANAMQTVVVLLPSAGDETAKTSPALLFAKRRGLLLQAAPWVTAVVPPWGFTPGVFHGANLHPPLKVARK